MQRNRRMGLAALLVVTFSLRAAPIRGAEAVIDAFSDASSISQFVANTNVAVSTVGSTTVVDPGLNDVIGGDRELTVTATSLGLSDLVVAGVVLPPVNFFEYNSSVQADGATTLVYDRNGAGLDIFLAFAQGVEVEILLADAAAVFAPGFDVTVTLTDMDLTSAAVTQTVLLPVAPMAPLALDFPFSSFTGVDPSRLFSIQIDSDPQEAGDFRYGVLQTFGTPETETICDDDIDNNNNGLTDCADPDCIDFPGCAYKAPALSPSLTWSVFAVLALAGLAGIARLKRAQRH